MSIKRITISVSDDMARTIKRAAGRAPVSSWVADVITDHLNVAELERQWQLFYEDVNPSRADRRKAEVMLRRLTKRGSQKGAA
jgi:hypothetical protein